MKKLISVILLLTLMLGLGACEKSDPNGLQIGYSKINITPDFLVGLGGYDNPELRKNTNGVLEDIFLTCIAAKEGEETILFFTMDTIRMHKERADIFRAVITPATGIPGEKIFFGATHSHYCPVDDAYDEFMKDKFVQAAQEAIADLTPSTIYAASTQAPKMSFNRHYIMSDGSYAGSNFGDWSLGIEGHAGEADQELQVVKFDRVGRKTTDVVLVNFQAHNVHAIDMNSISPGHAGALRDELESLSGCHVAYFTGASGNLSPSSKIKVLSHGLGDWSNYGKRLGEIANEALQNLQPVGGSGIATATCMTEVEVDHSWDHKLEEATHAYEMNNTLGGQAGNAFAVGYGLHSNHHAGSIVTRASMPATDELYQGAFRIHDLAFAAATYEMFSENGVAIKEGSPYEFTLIFSGNRSYIPSKATFAYQSYEGDVTYYVEGTAELLQDKFIDLLKGLQ